MKTNPSHMKELARKLFHHKEGVQRIKLMHPNRDWLIGVLITIVSMMLMASWSAFVYYQQRDGVGGTGQEIEVAMPLYRAEMVDQALNIFADRQATMNTLRGVSPTAQSLDTVDEAEVSTATSSSESPVTDDPVDVSNEDESLTDQVIDTQVQSDSTQPLNSPDEEVATEQSSDSSDIVTSEPDIVEPVQ